MKLTVIFLLAIIMISCNDLPNEEYSSLQMMEIGDEEYLLDYKNASYDLSMDVPATQQPAPSSELDRKLLKEGHLTFECADALITRASLRALYAGLDAYLSSEGQNDIDSHVVYFDNVRVPAIHFDSLVKQLESFALRVQSKDINTRDITEDLIDAKARLKTKRALEHRYLEVLELAKDVKDILSIEREIGTVRADIESIEGRLNYMENRVAFSTLNISYYQLPQTGWGHAISNAFVKGAGNLGSFAIELIQFWPFIFMVSITLGWWLRRRNSAVATSSQ